MQRSQPLVCQLWWRFIHVQQLPPWQPKPRRGSNWMFCWQILTGPSRYAGPFLNLTVVKWGHVRIFLLSTCAEAGHQLARQRQVVSPPTTTAITMNYESVETFPRLAAPCTVRDIPNE